MLTEINNLHLNYCKLLMIRILVQSLTIINACSGLKPLTNFPQRFNFEASISQTLMSAPSSGFPLGITKGWKKKYPTLTFWHPVQLKNHSEKVFITSELMYMFQPFSCFWTTVSPSLHGRMSHDRDLCICTAIINSLWGGDPGSAQSLCGHTLNSL